MMMDADADEVETDDSDDVDDDDDDDDDDHGLFPSCPSHSEVHDPLPCMHLSGTSGCRKKEGASAGKAPQALKHAQLC